ncbi:meiotic nuclear division protein 1 [Lichtheimia hyalospora FSU 10163]|nr:meiotic nuclear division protein 1 [Lichtheimia hyalospora FSU 10163]
MSRKGISLDEKRRRMEKYLHETCDFFQLKELEKAGPKLGVVQQSVKEVVQGLIDDGLVCSDKIGPSNYYWSYPSAAEQAIRSKEEQLQAKLDQERKKNEQLKREIELAQQGRQPSDERDKVLLELKELQAENKALEKEMQLYKDNDPETYKAKEKAIVICKEAVNRWTENIWIMQSYCTNKYGIDREEFNRAFNIDSELDTIE